MSDVPRDESWGRSPRLTAAIEKHRREHGRHWTNIELAAWIMEGTKGLGLPGLTVSVPGLGRVEVHLEATSTGGDR